MTIASLVSRCSGAELTPAELERHVLEDALDRVRVVYHPELVRAREQQRVGGELLDELVGLGGVRQYAAGQSPWLLWS